jgi:mannose-6-phosphate isomerase-like protein (cupin superfamily)
MPSLNRTIVNPYNGERVTFLTTSQETNGEFLRAKVELPASALGPPLVFHLAFSETFEVLEGQLDVIIGGKNNHRVLTAGEKALVPVNTLHRFWNSSHAPSVFMIEVRPASRFEELMRTLFGLVHDGKVKSGMPNNIWEFALFTILSESYIQGPPVFLQKVIFGLLARIARMKGYDPDFPQYTRPQSVVGQGLPLDSPARSAHN